MEQSPLEKIKVTQLDKKLPAINGTLRFITVFTSAWHWSLSYTRCIQSQNFPPYFSKINSNIIFSSYLCLPSGFLPLGFLTKTLYAFLISPIHATRPAILMFGEACKLWSSSLSSFVQSTATSSYLAPSFLLSTLFSNTICVLPSVWETKFHTHAEQQEKLWFYTY